ncbi:MAG TPA: hypothetical protein VHF58_09755 [Solirubrobacterales bacterium]|nr:hypothetical protein [Solirubrobacterales bacterium]
MATGTRGHLLVVAADEVAGDEVIQAITERANGNAEVRVVAPALTDSRLEHHAGAIDEAREHADERLRRSLEHLQEAGIEAAGEVGDSDLRLAIQDALQTFEADEILIVAHRDNPPPLEHQGIAEAEESFSAPITELYVTHDGPEAHVADVEHAEGGGDDSDRAEVGGQSRNLPPYSPFDLLGILVAIIGTGILVVLAAACGSEETFNAGTNAPGFGGCEVRLLLAGLMGLINLAHVVGLMLFQAGPYRGVWRTFFAHLSLWGTPAAIVVSLLVE